jgi:hypothetical protein
MNYVFGREIQELTQGSKASPAYQRPSNTFALVLIKFPNHPIPEAIEFLAATLVPS